MEINGEWFFLIDEGRVVFRGLDKQSVQLALASRKRGILAVSLEACLLDFLDAPKAEPRKPRRSRARNTSPK